MAKRRGDQRKVGIVSVSLNGVLQSTKMTMTMTMKMMVGKGKLTSPRERSAEIRKRTAPIRLWKMGRAAMRWLYASTVDLYILTLTYLFRSEPDSIDTPSTAIRPSCGGCGKTKSQRWLLAKRKRGKVNA